MRQSHLEAAFAFQVRALGLPEPVREYRFAPPRRWRFDCCWPAHKVAVELEGGVWTGGRHVRGAGFEADCEKQNMAVLLGYRVLRFTRAQVTSGLAVRLTERLLAQREGRDAD